MALAWPRDLIGRRAQGEQRRGAQDGLKLPVFGDVAVLARLGVVADAEDVAELRFHAHPNVARMEARPPNAEGEGEVTIRDMVRNALRMRPDRIVVGECRGAEAMDMLQAMNTGHDGSLTPILDIFDSRKIKCLDGRERSARTEPKPPVAHLSDSRPIPVILQTTAHSSKDWSIMASQDIVQQLVGSVLSNPDLLSSIANHPYSTIKDATGCEEVSRDEASQALTALSSLANGQAIDFSNLSSLASQLLSENNGSAHDLASALFGAQSAAPAQNDMLSNLANVTFGQGFAGVDLSDGFGLDDVIGIAGNLFRKK